MATIKTNWLIGSITAIVLFLGAFFMVKAVETSGEVKTQINQTELHWFQVNANRPPGEAVTQSQVTYLGYGATPPAGADCGGSNFQCVSGFSDLQVNESNEIIGAQIPAMEASLKN